MNIAAILEILNLVQNTAEMIYKAVPGDAESGIIKEVKAERQALANGAGGMAEGQRQRLAAQGNAALNASFDQAATNLARTQSFDSGNSGMYAQQYGNLNASKVNAQNQLQSNIRQADLDEVTRRRQELLGKQQLLAQLDNERKSGASSGAGVGIDSTAFQSGQASRTTTGVQGEGAIAGAKTTAPAADKTAAPTSTGA